MTYKPGDAAGYLPSTCGARVRVMLESLREAEREENWVLASKCAENLGWELAYQKRLEVFTDLGHVGAIVGDSSLLRDKLIQGACKYHVAAFELAVNTQI